MNTVEKKNLPSLYITDYYGGTETVHGPFRQVSFHGLQTTVPTVQDPVVLYLVTDDNEDMTTLSVSLVHSISAATPDD